jgi:hypothetical protein
MAEGSTPGPRDLLEKHIRRSCSCRYTIFILQQTSSLEHSNFTSNLQPLRSYLIITHHTMETIKYVSLSALHDMARVLT